MTEPTTEAGRWLDDNLGVMTVGPDFRRTEDAIAAIENEAAKRVLAIRLDAVVAALSSEDEIAHGEAYSESRGGLGRCAYCGSDWPCRTQRGIDRLRGVMDGIAANILANPAETVPSEHE